MFIAPYILLSATAGQVADRFDKARVIRLVKLAEVALMLAAAAALWWHSPALQFAVLFGLGVQATFFSPLKYGILPDHLREDELVAGNGLVEAGTFLGILAGIIAGGALIELADGPRIVGGLGVAVALGGVASALRVLPAPSSARRPAHRLELVGADRGAAAHGAGQPAGVAVAAGPELVLGGRRHAGGGAADPGAGRGRRRCGRAHAAAGVLLDRRGRRLDRLLAPA